MSRCQGGRSQGRVPCPASLAHCGPGQLRLAPCEWGGWLSARLNGTSGYSASTIWSPSWTPPGTEDPQGQGAPVGCPRSASRGSLFSARVWAQRHGDALPPCSELGCLRAWRGPWWPTSLLRREGMMAGECPFPFPTVEVGSPGSHCWRGLGVSSPPLDVL